MIRMGPKKAIEKYRKVMNCVDVTPEVRMQIIENCAKYATIKSIRRRKFKVIAKKSDVTDGAV